MLRTLQLKNFRAFESFEVELEPDCTLITGPQGCGKTSILEGACVALGAWLAGFEGPPPRPFCEQDARVSLAERGSKVGISAAYPVVVSAQGEFLGQSVAWTAQMNSAKGVMKPPSGELAQLKALAQRCQKAVHQRRRVELPLIAYYRCSRLADYQQLDRAWRGVYLPSRTLAYTDCADASKAYKLFVEWMRRREGERLERIAALGAEPSRDELLGAYEDTKLQCVIDCVNQALHGAAPWRDLAFDKGVNGLTLDRLIGVEVMNEADREQVYGALPVELLPDGLRAIVLLIADLAWRSAVLNPHHGINAPQLTQGVVLIDTLELQLDSLWQGRLLGALRKLFPMLQLIISTNAQPVLESAPPHWIKRLGRL